MYKRQTFGCYIIMVCAYGFQKKAFVAVDVLYARLKPLAQNILHLITYLVLDVYKRQAVCHAGLRLCGRGSGT